MGRNPPLFRSRAPLQYPQMVRCENAKRSSLRPSKTTGSNKIRTATHPMGSLKINFSLQWI
jgi:hypothetical protein